LPEPKKVKTPATVLYCKDESVLFFDAPDKMLLERRDRMRASAFPALRCVVLVIILGVRYVVVCSF
jgi:hypothetical protein